jgi:lambda repressor-like predicted transcriptional regulator
MSAAVLDNAAGSFTDGTAPFLSARRIAERLGITLADLARIAGVARNTLTAVSSRRKVDQALSPLVRIIAMASEMTGDEQRAVIWFKHQPIPGFAGKTALDLTRDGKAGSVLNYLEAVRSGVYA